MKKVIIPIALAGLLILVGGIYFVWNVTKKGPRGIMTSPASSEEMTTGSFLDLLKLGKNLKCTFEYKGADEEMKGVSYVANNKVRTDTAVTTPTGENYESHFITDSEYIYTWSNMQEQGIKMKISDTDTSETNNTNQESYYKQAELDKNFEYKCTPWVSDSSKFTPPEDVKFTDYTQMIEDLSSVQEQVESGDTNAMCSMCELSPDESAKAECKAQFFCP